MFITPAFAQSNPLSALFGGDSGGMMTSLLPLILIVVIMYFLVLRPQQQKVKQHQALVRALRRGDTVVTNGGLVGKVTKVVDDDQIEVEIADGVRVRQMRSMVIRRARQGRAGEGRERKLSPRSVASLLNQGRQSHVVFHAMESGGHFADRRSSRACSRCRISFPRARCARGRHSRNATSCSASTCRADRACFSRSILPLCARRSCKA